MTESAPVQTDTNRPETARPETARPETFRPKTFRRSRTDRMLGGVCGGAAEALGIDAALIRVGLVAVTLLGFGAGAVIYFACWLLVPEAETI